MAQTANDMVYSAFINGLMDDGKIEDRAEGSFRATVELRPYDRFSSGCDVRFTYVHAYDTFRLTVTAHDLLQDGEKHEQGMFPCEFDTNLNPKWHPTTFEQKGRALHVSGKYVGGKPYEAVITPL